MKVKYKKVETIPEFIDAIRIRVDVFIKEQNCPPGWEPDEFDKVSDHYIASVNGIVVATARIRQDSPDVLKIERMVVKKDYRKKGIGLDLTKYLIKGAQKKKPSKIWIEAQSYAQKFYEKSGFKTVSEEYDLYNIGIPHVTMEYKS